MHSVIALIPRRPVVYGLNLMLWFGHKNMSLVGVGNSRPMNNYQFFNTLQFICVLGIKFLRAQLLFI